MGDAQGCRERWVLDDPISPDPDGEEVYGDYAVDPDTGVVTSGQAYLLGVGFWNASANEPQYVHGDQIGTLSAVSHGASAAAARVLSGPARARAGLRDRLRANS